MSTIESPDVQPRSARVLAAIARHDEVWLPAAALLFFLFLLSLGDYLMDGDAYYHIRIADLLRSRGWIHDLPWMAASIHAERFVDFHFLFHWLQVPFVLLTPDLLAAARLSAAVFSALGVCTFVLLLRSLGTAHRWFWTLFLALGSPIFAGRWLFGRGGALFIAVLFLFLLSLAEDRPRLTALLSLASVWVYPGFPLLVALALLYDAVRAIRERRPRCAAVVAAVMGSAAGLLLHPAFPRQFGAYWLELGIQWLRPAGLEPIAEWLPGEAEVVLPGAVLPVAALTAAVVARAGRSPLASTLLGASLLLLLALALSLKSLEYFVPVAVCAVASCSWRPLGSRLRAALASAALALIALWSLPQVYNRVLVQHRLTDPRAAFDAADWLAANTEEGSLVLASWGRFPALFFRSLHNRYPFGLNPAYAYGADRTRYLLMRAFLEGGALDPLEAPRVLGARWALLHRRDEGPALARALAAGAQVAYQNAVFAVLRFP